MPQRASNTPICHVNTHRTAAMAMVAGLNMTRSHPLHNYLHILYTNFLRSKSMETRCRRTITKLSALTSARTVPTPTTKHTRPNFTHKNVSSTLQDETLYTGKHSQTSNESSDDWITYKKRHHERRKVHSYAPHNSPNEQTKACRDCSIQFTLFDETQAWFRDRGLQLAVRCRKQNHRMHNASLFAKQQHLHVSQQTRLPTRQSSQKPRGLANLLVWLQVICSRSLMI